MCKKTICLMSFVLLLCLNSSVFAQTYPGQMGVNLGGVSEAGGMFVDMAKEHHRYVRLPSGDMTYDSEGWPSCDTRLVLDFRLVAEWEGYIDDPEEYRHDNTGTYLCSFVGQADLAASGATIQNKVYNSGSNTTMFDLVITQRRVYCDISSTNTQRTAGSGTDTGFTDLKMIRPGYPADTTQTFTDDFINCLTSANFGAIRFHPVTNAWVCDQPYPDQIEWSERKLTTDAAQVAIEEIGKLEGAAWEYVIELCNQVGMDAWINVPVSASTDYVTQFATLLKNNLNSNLNIYVENGNEVWNGLSGTTSYFWNNAQATALGIGEHDNHARRTVELSNIFASVFGSSAINNRVRVILCSHAPMVKWWVQPMLEYINTNFGPPSDYIYGISSQLYFGASCSNGTVTQILDCCHDDITSQISETGGGESGRQQWVDKAADWSLVGGYFCYEGGFHIPHGGSTTNLDTQITAHRDQRAGTELKYNYDDAFFALGGNLAMQFTLSSSYHRHGCWGLTDDLADPDRNYKFQACRDLTGGGGPQPPGQASNPSPADAATGVSVEADISWTAGSGATSHDVYFGQDSTPDSGEFQGNQTGTTFDPGTLANSTTYYWRIDSVNAQGTTTGVVWSFTTETAPQPPGQASNPNPADAATGVAVNADVSWSAGTGATSHDVYFGIDPTPDSSEFQGNQTGTTFDPGTLASDTTYYWRIDELNAQGTTTGVVWSFTTVPGTGTGTGLQGDYYDNMDFTAFVLSRVDATVNFDWGSGSPDPSIGADLFSVRWTGFVEPLYSETYTFYTTSDDGVRLWVDSQLVIDNWTDHGPTEDSGTIALTGSVQYDIQMDFYENGGGAVAQLEWSSASQSREVIPQSQLYEPTAPSPPGQASNPSPADGATDISINADLSWTAGTGATSHDVYFGQDSTPDSGEFQGNQGGTTFDPGTFVYSTTYYWRIDEVNTGGTTIGTVWSFTTGSPPPPGQASNPNPSNGATSVSLDADLSWTAGAGATSHDVYFGTDSTPDSGEFQGNQGGTTFDPGTLVYSTTYYWRIDEVGAGGTTTGSVWSFTTESEPGAAIEFDSVGSNSSGTDGTTLSWSHTVSSGSNRVLVVGIAGEDSSGTDLNISSVTYGGAGMTLVANSTSTEGTSYLQRTALYYLLSPAVGTDTVTVTYSGSVAERSGGSISLRNADQAGAEAVATNGNTGSNSISTNITTQTNGAWVIDVVGCGNAGTFTATGGNTERYDVQGDSASAAGSTKLVASAGSTTMSWTHSGANRLAHSAAAFAPVSGPPVPPDPATNPSPADSATDVSINANLSWTPGTGATSHDVYFGTSSPGAFQGNQAGTTFDPGTLVYSTTYYWRIDEVNANGTTTGTVWSFTTEPVPPPGQATNPSPASGATDVSIDVTLSWTAGSGATSHDVYFGTDSTPDSGEFQDNQPGTSYDPGTLFNDITYYWRIDEVGAGGTTTGVVWSFTTEAATPPPGQASNPNPANGATDVSTSADLSWTAGSDATSHDVYFGTASPGSFQGNQTNTTFDPGTLANEITYYWRIDEKNAIGTTTGVVWSFTTEVAAAGDVEIIGSWTSGTTHAEEAGTDRALVFTAHAESSTADTDLGSVTYGGQSMTKVVDRIEATTYSAYTCAFILDEAGINAASGSTFAVTWNTAPSGTPAFTSVFLQNVNQSSLIGATGTGGSATTTAETPALFTNDGDMAIVAGTCGNAAQYSVINGFTEAIEVAPSSADGIGGYLACTGADVTPGVSHTNVNRQSVIGFVVKVGAGGPPPPPGQATNPSPADGATGVSTTPTLSWTAGSGAASHDVYFGDTTSPPFVQNQPGTTYDPGTLAEVTTYYWRIDEVGDGGTTTGTVWSFTTESTACTQDYCIEQASTAPVIDGSIDSVWGDAPTDSITNVILGTVSSDSDLSGTWRALWDSSNLYYLVEITDDAIVNDSNNAWDDDSIELYIDADNSKGTSYDGVNDYQYVFRWNDGTIHLGTSSATNTAGIVFDMVAVSGGYNFEISIPWTTLGVTPGAGNLIGLDVHVDDDDDGATRDGKKAWYATVDDSWADPSTFGTGELQP